MKRFCLILVSVILSFNTSAGTTDVKPKRLLPGDTYVRLTKLNNTNVRFEECLYEREESSCSIIGPKDSYSLKELKRLQLIESTQAAGTILADTIIGAGCAASGIIIYVAIGLGNGLSFLGASIVATSTAGLISIPLVDALNPVKQINQATSIRDKILNDEDVSTFDIFKFIERLEHVLSKTE
jgi:hypothetical protein